jgi:hypothetical protein
MKVMIRNDVVRKNIELLQMLVKKQSLQEIGKDALVLHAFVNRKTGDLQFAQKEENKKEWKAVSIKIHGVSPGSKESVFEIFDEEKQEAFQHNDLAPLAYGILVETIRILNDLASKLSKATVDAVLGELSECEITGAKTQPKDLIHDAWHQTDRMGAEDLLKDSPLGTYLFRKDEYAALLEEELRLNWGNDLSCFTLTYLEAKDKITDRTIVKKGDQWLFYDDDPNLSGSNYPNVYALLATLKKELKEPLLY